jgi:hypothetical protein
MIHYLDETFCPEHFACICDKGNTCERAWNAFKQAEAEKWMDNPPIMFFSKTPNCCESNMLTRKDAEKYHYIMGRVHLHLRNKRFSGQFPSFLQVKFMAQKEGLSINEIVRTVQWEHTIKILSGKI